MKKIDYDYSAVPTPRLADETLRHAERVYKVNDALWDATGPAFLSAIPLSIAASALLVENLSDGLVPGVGYPILFVLLVISTAIAVVGFRPYARALAACRRHTEESIARTEELNRRNRRPAAPGAIVRVDVDSTAWTGR